jgi:hypothetical protein
METERSAEGCNRNWEVMTGLDESMTFDTLTLIDMRRVGMLRLLKRSKERTVEFCDRCAQVCDAGCRAAAIRERTLALRLGVRV